MWPVAIVVAVTVVVAVMVAVAVAVVVVQALFRIRPSSIFGQSLTYFRKIYDRYVIAT